jgi:hypothetical protein
MSPEVVAAGFPCSPLSEPSTARPLRTPLLPLDVSREERQLADRFVRRAARSRVPAVAALLEARRPDLVVCDETDFGAMLAAERAGLPRAKVEVIASGSFVRPDVVGDAIAELRRELGLAADPALQMLTRRLVLSPFPPRFRDPAHPLPAGACSMRPAVLDGPDGESQAWQPPPGDGPLVYFTLGTVFNMESGNLLERVIAALRELPIRLVATVGSAIDPARLGPQPGHVQVRRFVPLAALLPHCELVVSHGGSGSVMGALTYGLPSLLLPMGADQPANAARCSALGVGVVSSASDADASDLAGSVLRALGDQRLRSNAQRLASEIAELPEASQAVPWLEALVAAGDGPGS